MDFCYYYHSQRTIGIKTMPKYNEVSESVFKENIKNIPCFFDSDITCAYPPLWATRKYQLADGRIAKSVILDFQERSFYISNT